MIRDLRTILDGWEYEPGKISVRKIIGRDGREKIQTRIDMGVLQIEVAGRPDGQRPLSCDSLLEFHERRLAHHIRENSGDDGFVVSPEQCRDLRQEAYLYYQRYLSLFVLEDFDGVERDTAHNLRVIDLCERYAAADADRLALRAQRPYVMMMNCRARAYRALLAQQYDSALAIVNRGTAAIELHCEQSADEEGRPPLRADGELRILRELHDEIFGKMPPDSPARMRMELASAVEREDYERAAELRDMLAARTRCA